MFEYLFRFHFYFQNVFFFAIISLHLFIYILFHILAKTCGECLLTTAVLESISILNICF